jgi:hypothetical protein
MKKILITNNSKLVSSNYDIIYTDSPYVIENHGRALYLDTLLDDELNNKVQNISKKGHLLNKEIIKYFFPKYQNRNIDLITIRNEYTNIFINIIKLQNLIDLYPDDKITIGITLPELYDYASVRPIDRFVNVYYWIVKLFKFKNIELVCKNFKQEELDPKDKPIDSWFLRLVNLDKKVLIFNLKKKIKLIKPKSKKVYIYNSSSVIREIEPYLYDSGITFINMPEINTISSKIKNILDEKKLKDILDNIFENNKLENIFKLTIFEICKKIINQNLEREISTKKYILKLDKSIGIILTNSLNTFDSLIFSKQLQDKGFKIIEAMHGMGKSNLRKSDILSYESCAGDMVLCFNKSEEKLFKSYDSKSLVHPISTVQQTKNIRIKSFQRFYVNRMLKIFDQKNVFYPSCIYPYNNHTMYGYRQTDKWNYNFEKKMIMLLSKINKRSIYKTYPGRCFIDTNPLIQYGESLANIKVISERFDFRYVNTIGDIFILGHLGGASTLMWMLGLNRPIIYLHTNKFRHLNISAQNMAKKTFITLDIDEDDWENNLENLLNRPHKELIEMWQAKQIYRDQYDKEWLMGMNLHAGKLGAKYINRFKLENTKKNL